MSKLTRCPTSQKAIRMIPTGRATAILGVAGALLTFGLGQLHLQFAVSNLEQETSRLQTRKMDLRDQINLVKGEVEARKQGERLLQHAKGELGMVEYSLHDVERVRVSSDLQERYMAMERSRSPESRLTEIASGDRGSWAEELASRLGLDSAASANVQGRE